MLQITTKTEKYNTKIQRKNNKKEVFTVDVNTDETAFVEKMRRCMCIKFEYVKVDFNVKSQKIKVHSKHSDRSRKSLLNIQNIKYSQ